VAVMRAIRVLNLALYLFGVIVIALVLNAFSRQESWRWRIDATKTRAYSLSNQTQALLADLKGSWTIALVMDERRADRSMRRQIDEVLSRYVNASPNIRAVRIDPSRPDTLLEYERLLAELSDVYRESILAYDAALDSGIRTYEALLAFSLHHAATLEQLAALLPADDPAKEPLQQRMGTLSVLQEQGHQVLAAVTTVRRVGESRPLPDYETARSTMAAALTQSARDLDEFAAIFASWKQRSSLESSEIEFVAGLQREFESMSQRLA
jgi:hypothetical protein